MSLNELYFKNAVTSKCKVYNSLSSRLARTSTLGICGNCLSSSHVTEACPGHRAALHFKCYVCQKSEHHVAMCPKANSKVSINAAVFNSTTISDTIVPLVSLTVQRGKRSTRCAFLIDSGSQISVINKQLVEKNVGVCLSPPITKYVSSFCLPSAERVGYNYLADLRLPGGDKLLSLFFAIDNFTSLKP